MPNIKTIRNEHTHSDGLMICDDGADGTTQKLGFFGATPSVQRKGAAQAGLAADATAAAIVVLVNELRASLVEKGLIKGSA